MIIPLLWALGSFAVQAAVADPLAPSRSGWVSCVKPDSDAKTCVSIYRYTWRDQKIFYEVDLGVDDQPLTILRMRSQMYYRDDAACSRTSQAEQSLVGMTIDGAEATEEALREMRREVAEMLKDLDGQEYCVRYEPAANGRFTTHVSVEDIRRPDSDSVMMWIRPDDGWRVAP